MNHSDHLKLMAFGRHLRILCLAIAIGAVSGYGAVLFRHGIKVLQYLFYQNSNDFLTFAATVPAYLKVGLPTIGGLIVGLFITYGAAEAKGHGVPEVMEAVALRGGRIRKRVAIVKILASWVCIGSGGSVGREGPMVQIGASFASTVGQFLDIRGSQLKTLIGCGAAAGIAATFNAPIAGTLFALEILLGDIGLASFSPVVLSAVMATTISRHFFGSLPSFIIPLYSRVSVWEIFIYPFLGVLAGVVAILFVTTLYKCEDFFEKLPLPNVLKPALSGLLLGLILLLCPQIFGVGYGAMNIALTGKISVMLLLLLVFAKIIATSVTLGGGGSGGIFAPSLFIGAMTGALFGTWVHNLFPSATAGPGAYALVAMGALVAGTTQAPITAILIIFELTNDYNIILPLMVTCLISTIISSVVLKGSIYTIKLIRRGIDIHGGMEQNTLRSIKVSDLMLKKICQVPTNATIPQILSAFREQDASYLHVVDEKGDLVGILSFRDLRSILSGGMPSPPPTAGDIATRQLSVVSPVDNIPTALHLMSIKGISQLPVVKELEPGKVLGILRQKDILTAYDKALVRKELEQ